MDLVGEVGYAQAYSFKYSRRPGTPGAVMTGQLAEDVKSERLARLQDLLNRQQIAFNETFIGRTIPVLFDRRGARPNQISGRSPHMQAVYVNFDTPSDLAVHLGGVYDVQILAARPNSLAGGVVRRGDDFPEAEISEAASA